MSGRSGRALSASLRPACASDPTAQPIVGPLGVGERQPRRLPSPVSASGPRTRRRDGSCSPRGGFHPHPPFTTALLERCEHVFGWVEKMRRCRAWPISPEPAGTPRAHRRRETLNPTESLSRGRGTARDPTARRTLGSRAEEPAGAGRGGAQAFRWTPWHRQEKQPHAVKNGATGPRGKRKRPVRDRPQCHPTLLIRRRRRRWLPPGTTP
jgi:hypothetical protein